MFFSPLYFPPELVFARISGGGGRVANDIVPRMYIVFMLEFLDPPQTSTR